MLLRSSHGSGIVAPAPRSAFVEVFGYYVDDPRLAANINDQQTIILKPRFRQHIRKTEARNLPTPCKQANRRLANEQPPFINAEWECDVFVRGHFLDGLVRGRGK